MKLTTTFLKNKSLVHKYSSVRKSKILTWTNECGEKETECFTCKSTLPKEAFYRSYLNNYNYKKCTCCAIVVNLKEKEIHKEELEDKHGFLSLMSDRLIRFYDKDEAKKVIDSYESRKMFVKNINNYCSITEEILKLSKYSFDDKFIDLFVPALNRLLMNYLDESKPRLILQKKWARNPVLFAEIVNDSFSDVYDYAVIDFFMKQGMGKKFLLTKDTFLSLCRKKIEEKQDNRVSEQKHKQDNRVSKQIREIETLTKELCDSTEKLTKRKKFLVKLKIKHEITKLVIDEENEEKLERLLSTVKRIKL